MMCWVLAAYAAIITVVALLVMRADKKAATRRDGERVPERTLFLIAGLGGGAGVLVGMFLFEHKLRKPSFFLPALLLGGLGGLALWGWSAVLGCAWP